MEAIRTKYRGAKFMKVADLPELKGEVCLVIAQLIFNLSLIRYWHDLQQRNGKLEGDF